MTKRSKAHSDQYNKLTIGRYCGDHRCSFCVLELHTKKMRMNTKNEKDETNVDHTAHTHSI